MIQIAEESWQNNCRWDTDTGERTGAGKNTGEVVLVGLGELAEGGLYSRRNWLGLREDWSPWQAKLESGCLEAFVDLGAVGSTLKVGGS